MAGINAALEDQGRAAAGPRPQPGVHRRADRRPGDQGRRRAVPHVHVAGRVSAAAAARQRRPPADAARPPRRPGRRRRLGAACRRRKQGIAELDRATCGQHRHDGDTLEQLAAADRRSTGQTCATSTRRCASWHAPAGRGRAGGAGGEVRRLHRPAGGAGRAVPAAGDRSRSRRTSTTPPCRSCGSRPGRS